MTKTSTPSITILTQWYPPEQAPFGWLMRELAQGLAARGWRVTIVTGFPNHPGGTVFGGYRKRWLLRERDAGIDVIRVWLATSPRRSFINRLLTFATFTLTACWRLLREPRTAVIFAVLQPLSVGLFLPLIARIKRSALVFNLQDLHPDTQIRLGMLKNPLAIGVLRAIERFAYRSCAGLCVISEPFRDHCVRLGVAPQRVAVIENWIDARRVPPLPRDNAFRQRQGYASEHFVALWAGTLGHVSGAAVILAAAELLRDHPRLRFLIVGEGPVREPLMREAKAKQLDNILFLPFQPEADLPQMQAAADVSLVTLAPQFADSSVPSKVLAYMSAQRPIIAAVPAQSQTAAVIHRVGCGRVIPPEDPRALAEALLSAWADPEALATMARQGRQHVIEHLSLDAAVASYESAFMRASQQ